MKKENRVYFFEYNLNKTKETYEKLYQIACNSIQDSKNYNIYWNIEKCDFIHPDVAAYFGSLINWMSLNNVKVVIQYSQKKAAVFDYLRKNGVLKTNNYIVSFLDDIFRTIIEFQKVEFDKYTEFLSKLTNNKTINRFKLEDRNLIYRLIAELIDNTKTHAEIEFCYFMAQYFPQKNEFHFSVIDFGKGISKTVEDYYKTINEAFIDESTIEWAIKEGNTTKIQDAGGLGLAELIKEVNNNNGECNIISGVEYWSITNGTQKVERYSEKVPGTIINVCLRGV